MRTERRRRLQGKQSWKNLHHRNPFQKFRMRWYNYRDMQIHLEKLQSTGRHQLGSRTPYRKLKDMQLPKALLERARDHIIFPAM
jgi:hypothetical protein